MGSRFFKLPLRIYAIGLEARRMWWRGGTTGNRGEIKGKKYKRDVRYIK